MLPVMVDRLTRRTPGDGMIVRFLSVSCSRPSPSPAWRVPSAAAAAAGRLLHRRSGEERTGSKSILNKPQSVNSNSFTFAILSSRRVPDVPQERWQTWLDCHGTFWYYEIGLGNRRRLTRRREGHRIDVTSYASCRLNVFRRSVGIHLLF